MKNKIFWANKQCVLLCFSTYLQVLFSLFLPLRKKNPTHLCPFPKIIQFHCIVSHECQPTLWKHVKHTSYVLIHPLWDISAQICTQKFRNKLLWSQIYDFPTLRIGPLWPSRALKSQNLNNETLFFCENVSISFTIEYYLQAMYQKNNSSCWRYRKNGKKCKIDMIYFGLYHRDFFFGAQKNMKK